METEIIFNIFPICNKGLISSIGYRFHEKSGSDEEKISFLLSRIELDAKELKYIKTPENYKVIIQNGTEINALTHERFFNLLKNGQEGMLYEPIFQLCEASESPLSVTTMIIDGEIKAEVQKKVETMAETDDFEELMGDIPLPDDYLEKYLTRDGFDFISLIDEDFLEDIMFLFHNQKYVSAVKLLMVAIETFGFLEYGDSENNFKNWLKNFADLSDLRLTIDELWEYRNSILCIKNYQSQEEAHNQYSRLSFCISDKEADFSRANDGERFLNLQTLLSLVTLGIVNWISLIDEDESKFGTFIDRYERIISGTRYNKIKE